jgi:putative peptidoglycan binding protein
VRATVFELDVKPTSFVASGVRQGLVGIVLAMALLAYMPTAACALPGGPGGATDPSASPSGQTPFDRHGMWIWYVDRSEGGSIPRIVARAQSADIGTLYVKEGDGGSVWSQFNPGLVDALHRGGLDVCAWQFVYGERPLAEARVGAAAMRRGADCLVIDAEGDYEGRYAAADAYIRALRARIGPSFPLSLAGFPYVDYHPSFPYSVFLGPEGASFNQPQMYWKAIGASVRAVYEHTYLFNRLWGRPIYPVGQTYESPGRAQVVRFRRFASSYGGLPPSWWDWQETDSRTWGALGAQTAGAVAGYEPVADHPTLKRGSRGDLVVWAQEHLVASGQAQMPITGIFGKLTDTAVRSFQATHGLAADGKIGTTTWSALLGVEPVRMRWSARRATGAGRVTPARRPASASLPAHAYEIDPGPAP